MDVEQLKLMIKRGEDSRQQFKLKMDSVNAVAAEICAFSNSEGGVILVGVSDAGEVLGLNMDEVKNLNQHISNACAQKIDPPVSVTTENILIDDNNVVMAIHIPRGINKFYMANGKDIWVKVGADKRRARREEIQRLLQESGHLYADEMAVEGTTINDMSMFEFKRFYAKRTGEIVDEHALPLDTILTNLKLLDRGRCTLAGLLLFGYKPEEKRPNLSIQTVSFFGNELSGDQYRDSRLIHGNLGILYRYAHIFLVGHLTRKQGDQNFNSLGIAEIPDVALEEALMNALIHRNYLINSQIRLFIFDNRVEIISPGSLPNTATIETIKMGIHIERNPIIASLVKDIENVPYRGVGTGISRILRTCREAGVRVEFVNEKEAEQFKVIFWRESAERPEL